ncbi:MAG: sulfite exporter TauE/SafE family protein [Rhodobacteraceae bacterium]|uniref:sulfite exporter TauE/SafE family protein n=1 Tax=Salipiger thiooxidans TaxID=282683 RepID=UPI001A8ECD34|nr:sulfite exporter TauE/SafE family protein [Salipiger thiooxidans]MBN8189122.1 sulfite exporter TauE/SafE family protein [Salipiger thiooxidans]MBR9839213.1 sulfite exporter TauE/SafE family protein [Paracoccaceae bacterium]
MSALLADPGTLALLCLGLIVAGALIGLLAGLFGVGGGAISVPVFYETFLFMDAPADIAMPLAVGTSLAMIIPTSILSAKTHAEKGALDMPHLRAWALPVTAGVLIGSAVARFAPAEVFQIVFAAVAGFNAFKMLFVKKPWLIREGLPGEPLRGLYGAIVGLLSALMGIGGGAISNLILTLHGWSMHRAVATSAGVGLLIAIPGAIGYVVAGWGKPGLPPDAVGFVSLAALVLTLPTALLTTRRGARLAHALSRETLTRLFGLFLAIVAIRFVIALF